MVYTHLSELTGKKFACQSNKSFLQGALEVMSPMIPVQVYD